MRGGSVPGMVRDTAMAEYPQTVLKRFISIPLSVEIHESILTLTIYCLYLEIITLDIE